MIGLIFTALFMVIRLSITLMIWTVRVTFMVVALTVSGLSSVARSRSRH